MNIKTTEGDKNVASQGVGVTGLTLGSVALGLELFRNNGLGNLLGGNSSNEITDLKVEIAKLQSEKYTDQVQMVLGANICALDKRVTAIEVAQPLRQQIIEQQIDCLAAQQLRQQIIEQQIDCLAQKVNGITAFYVPATSVTPQPMPLFNAFIPPVPPVPPAASTSGSTTTTGSGN